MQLGISDAQLMKNNSRGAQIMKNKAVKNLAVFALSIASFGASSTAFAGCPVFKAPSNFTAEGEFFTIGTDMNLVSGKKPVGSIKQRMLNFNKTFDLLDERGQKVAQAKDQFFSFGSTSEVFDCNGKLIGTIKEEVFQSLFRPMTLYKILDAKGNEIATSEKLESFSTYFTIKNKQGQEVAEMRRPFINWFSDKWEINIQNSNGIDPRILVMIPAFKTAADAERKSKSAMLDPNSVNKEESPLIAAVGEAKPSNPLNASKPEKSSQLLQAEDASQASGDAAMRLF
jgi:uncharacterized protein YxjI